MEEVAEGLVTAEGGLEGDHKGPKFPKRQLTVLAREAWQDAVDAIGRPDLPWTVRRANLLVEGADLPRAAGGIVQIGSVIVEVTFPTVPCKRMEEAAPGLLKALHLDWRGGITCRVIKGGILRICDAVEVVHAPPERVIRLPG
jgi:MOSC domain-containing protein YiiM